MRDVPGPGILWGRAEVFRDRADAGSRLAAALAHLRPAHPVVLGLPRGGVPVAAEVAQVLEAPLDVALVRKLGLPSQPELAVGAIGEDGVRVVNQDVRRAARVSEDELAAVEARERSELDRRARLLRSGRPAVPLRGRTVLIVDDGIATGSTATAACAIARAHGAVTVVVAAPVAPAASVAQLSAVADEIVCTRMPDPFFAIGQWYDDFSQTSEEVVVSILSRGTVRPGSIGSGGSGTSEGGSHARARPGERMTVATAIDVLVDGFGRVHEEVHAVLDGLTVGDCTRRPEPGANTIGWLIWHLTRVQDDHVSGSVGTEQRWTAGGWFDRFDLPFDRAATGYGQSVGEVGEVTTEPELLTAYFDAVHQATMGSLRGLSEADLDRIVDRRWDPPVTLGVRLVSVLSDDLQHVGQAAYVRGLLP